MLPTPRFHHIHLNSVDPEKAAAFYAGLFPTTRAGQWGGHTALFSPNDVMILFDKVDRPPPTLPQSAIWHFGWHVPDAQRTTRSFAERADVRPRPLYTGDADGGSVAISSDTWPGPEGMLGRTRAQIAEAKAQRLQPVRKGGFAYFSGGPEDALFEIAGDYPQEHFNHVHMWHDQPLCALLWYQQHLNAPVRQGWSAEGLTEGNCRVERGPDRSWPALSPEGMFRVPRAGVEFGDVAVIWYMNQGTAPLAPSRGQMQDHIALAVADLDAWVDKLTSEGIAFLEPPHPLDDTRAAMIEGPSREAIELVEVK